MVQGCDVLSWLALRETSGAFWASAIELRVCRSEGVSGKLSRLYRLSIIAPTFDPFA